MHLVSKVVLLSLGDVLWTFAFVVRHPNSLITWILGNGLVVAQRMPRSKESFRGEWEEEKGLL